MPLCLSLGKEKTGTFVPSRIQFEELAQQKGPLASIVIVLYEDNEFNDGRAAPFII